MTWRVTTTEPGPMSGLEMLVHVINCRRVFRKLSPGPRAALLAAVDGRLVGDIPPGVPHPLTVRALAVRGLADEDGALTPAGVEVRRWSLP